MKNKFLAAGVVFGLIAGGTFAAGAVGKDDSGREVELEKETEHGPVLNKKEVTEVEKTFEKVGAISFEKAAKIAKGAATGEITDAEAEMEHGRVKYEFKLKDEKKETELKIDGTTGKIIKIESEDEREDDKCDDD
ncbi:PepSY domain-containing protein [Neobacillus piezotolerans]|nr:PepSY domain-containing protein [Neobacillus piezotolerans]